MRARTLLASLALVASVFLLYAQVRGFAFVAWDDNRYIYENPRTLQGLSLDGLRWALTAVAVSNWHPVTWASYMLDAELFGSEPAGYHLMSVALHAVNAVLLLLALRTMTGAFWPSLLVAALFALHPLRVESVAWVSERKDLLSGLFWILALIAYTWYVRRVSIGRYLLVCAAFALGLMSKPMVVTLPAVLMLLDLWPLGRWQGLAAAAPEPPSGRRPLHWLALEKIPLLALSAASSVVTVAAQRSGGALVDSVEQLSLPARAAYSLVSYVKYLGKTVWPTGLGCLYPHPMIVRGDSLGAVAVPGALAGLLLLGVTLVVWRSSRGRGYLLVGWLWFLGTMVPVIGVIQVGSREMADRYTYLPLIGIYLMVAWAARDLVARWPQARVPVVAASLVAVLASMAVTYRQIGVWRDSRTLFEHTLRVTENNFLIHNNLGSAYLKEGDLARARQQFEEAVRINPGYATGLRNLGLVYDRSGDRDRAAAQYQKAIDSNPRYAAPLNDLGLLLASGGRLDQAIDLYRRALGIDPRLVEAHINLGSALARKGAMDEAARHFEQAIHIDPGNAEAHNNLGSVHQRKGDLGAAAREFEQAIAIRPGYANAHNNLGILLARRGDLATAVSHFETAVRLDPRNTGARENLELARRMLRDGR